MGVLFTSFGIVLIVFGLVAVLLGTPLWISVTHFVLGLLSIAAAAASGFSKLSEIWARDATRRGLKYGGNAVIQTLLIAGILAAVAVLSVRYPQHWDWTEAGTHSLSRASAEVLEQIGADGYVEILAFYVQGGQGEGRTLLDLYTYESDRVHIKVYDPNKRPDLAERHEIRTNGVLIVCAGDCETAKGTVRVAQASEEDLTKAIRSVISEKRKVYFLTGHGEGDPADQEVTGYSRAKLALEDENIQVESLLLVNREDVPEDADAVIVAGPNHSLLGRELEALDRYLRAGGSLLVLSDPIVVSGLEDQVRAWGVELGSDIIVDQQIQLFAGPQLGVQPVVTDYGVHAITQKLRGGSSPTLFNLARSVRAVEGEGRDGVVELVRTGQSSWAESDVETFVAEGRVGLDPAADRAGPVPLAVALELDAAGEDDPEAKGRIVVVGDADFARNRYIAEFFNIDLFLNAISWLVGEEGFITIERKTARASSVLMTSTQVATFQYLGIFVLPELVLLIGLLSWSRRRT